MPPLQKLPRIVNLDLTDIAQEFELTITRRTKSFTMQARQAVDVLVGLGPNATFNGPYYTLKAGIAYWEDSEMENAADVVLYIRDPANADTVVEALLWEEDR